MAAVRLLCLDVDGVLTDGALYFTETGREIKTFSSQDGHALKMLASTGVATAIITGRATRLVARRARELGIDHLYQGARDKRVAFDALLARTGLDASMVAHVGDDIPDLPILVRAGLAVAPGNLNPAIRPYVHHVTTAAGGAGAVRELCELIMRVQGTWDAALAPYL
ncbi:MAG TPA: HAD hydrolase family protein [Pseudomonadales bacterium]|nr:HAD hydrolase family protein [Pseudomonadales bacterium]